MKSFRIVGLGTLLAVASTSAVAFQEQQGGSGASAPKAPAQGLEGGVTPPSLAPAIGASGKPSGVEIRIPGLGQLGVLPKLDLGLELLYGASEHKSSDSLAVNGGSDDMAIKGTLRRRF